MATRQESEQFIAKLRLDLKGEESGFSFIIPGWSPVDWDMGQRWITSQLWEGFYVAYHIDVAKRRVVLKTWEFGEIEPPFAAAD